MQNNSLDSYKHYRSANLKSLYGLTLEEYEEMLREQDGKCAICGELPSPTKLLDVDHDHENKTVRGLLCNHCNTALGLVKEDPEILSAMIDYLEAH